MKITGYPGYRFEPCERRLLAPNEKTVCIFGSGWRMEAVEEAAKEHAEKIDVALGRLERLLEEKRGREAS